MQAIGTAREFDRLLTTQTRVIAKFYTDWCPDCRRIEKPFAEYARANSERAAIVEIHAEQVQELADRYDVKGIPSFLVFDQGKLFDRLYSRDAKTVRQVLTFVEQALSQLDARTSA